MAAPKTMVRNLVQMVGLDVRRVSFATRFSIRLVKALEFAGVNLVLDVGANRGQFSQDLRRDGYKGRIVSFEPLSDAHQLLTAAAAGDSDWTIHDRGAVGDDDGEVTINVSANSVSSSILPIGDEHVNANQESRYIAQETVPVQRLDGLLPKYATDNDRTFLKIDAQGFEWQVLDGAAEALKNCQGLLLEASLTELYEGQRLWMDLIDRMKAAGFVVWAIEPGFMNQESGRMLQCDVVFMNENLIEK